MPGMIMLWNGSVATIPSGWHLCDGTVGTPDLRNKFIIAAGGTYSPGAAGGSSSHTHTFITAGHAHDLMSDEFVPDISPDGQLSHNTSVSQDTGTTVSSSNVPPYYALCYIMKL